ncbi:MAG: ROK family protein [Planctomycetia bacterium]|nr:ROK family protein [Planctomycetia bacterium]
MIAPQICPKHTTDPRRHTALAIDIGGSKMMLGLVELREIGHERWNYRVLQKTNNALPCDIRVEGILEKIADCSRELLREGGISSFERVGANIPGLADERIWIYAPFSGIQNFPIAEALEKMFDRPVRIDNDVNACALAEKVLGKCGGVRDFIWLTISNGVGGGLFLNNDVYRGAKGFSGELGHVCVVPNGRLCGCGKRGCVEAECAGPGIAAFYRSLFTTPTEAVPTEFVPTRATAREIAQRAREGEPQARQTFERTGRLLGFALANAANILNPEKIVLGGGVVQSWDIFAPAMERTFEEHLFKRANEHLRLEKTSLGYDAALLGAAALTLPRE